MPIIYLTQAETESLAGFLENELPPIARQVENMEIFGTCDQPTIELIKRDLEIRLAALDRLKAAESQAPLWEQIRQKALDLSWAIEKLPASELQTEISLMASDLYSELDRRLGAGSQ